MISRRDAETQRRRLLLGKLFVLLGLALLMAAESPAADTEKGPAPLRAGIYTDYPPVAFKKNGQIAGIEADFADRLASELKRPVEKVEVAWDDLIPALRDKRIDVIMSGMSITAEREKVVAFTEPYLRVGQMAVVLAKNLPRLRDYDAMEAPSARVGYQTNTTGESYVRKSLARAQRKGYDSAADGVAALRAGEIDFFVHDAPTVWRLTGQFDPANADLAGRYRPLTTEYLAWAVRKDDARLLEELNGVLTRWEKDGVIDTILDRWIRVRKVTIEVAPPR